MVSASLTYPWVAGGPYVGSETYSGSPCLVGAQLSGADLAVWRLLGWLTGGKDIFGEIATPAYPRLFGNPDVRMGIAPVVHGTFDSGTTGWTFTGTGANHCGVQQVFTQPEISGTIGSCAWGKTQTQTQLYETMAK